MGLVEYYGENVGQSKYAHAFSSILKAKPAIAAPNLSKDEKQYIRTAIWSEYQFENLPQNRAANNMIASISQQSLQNAAASKSGKRGNSSSQIDKLISQKAPQTQNGVITYDLKDLG
jgi:hypothetical protein